MQHHAGSGSPYFSFFKRSSILGVLLIVGYFAPAIALAARPTISGSPPTQATVGVAYAFTPKASDADGDGLIFWIQNRPGWASFSWRTGALTGKPTATGVNKGITIGVSDSWSRSRITWLPSFDITVNGGTSTQNRAPTISGTPPTTAVAGQAYSFTPTASDPDGNALTFTINQRPAWASFDSTTGRLSGTPTAAQVGPYPNVAIGVTDGTLSASLPTFSITVGAGGTTNRPPIISGTPPTSVVAGQLYSFTPTASDPDGNALTFTISQRPAWASFNSTTGRLSGTPTAAQVGPYPNVAIGVTDGTLSAALAQFSINVMPVAFGSATLSWTPPTTRTDGQPLTNLAGYRVLWGTSSGSYPNSVRVTNPGLTSYVVQNLSPATYYFVVRAFDSNNVESSDSNVAQKTVQ